MTLRTLTRRLPFLVIAVAAIAGFFLLRPVISLEALAANHARLQALRDAHYGWASLGFVLVYALIVALSLPGATVATLAGGFLFGLFPGVAYNAAAASIGAVAVFLAARAGFGRDLARRIADRGGAVARVQAGLQRNEWSSLLVMRLVPAVPFFLANLLPAVFGARLVPFAVTTVVGILPAALIFTSVGAGLGEVFDSGAVPRLDQLLSGRFVLPLLGLAVLAALPMLVRAVRTARGGA